MASDGGDRDGSGRPGESGHETHIISEILAILALDLIQDDDGDDDEDEDVSQAPAGE